MADMTFNTVAGQPVDRELLILFVNTGTDSAAVWSPRYLHKQTYLSSFRISY